MTDSSTKKTKGGWFLPALCNVIGILLILLVLAVALMLVYPKGKGYELYEVTSASMEPTIPLGSVVYVTGIEPQDAAEGDVIAYLHEDSLVIHRVVDNNRLQGILRTKGDANSMEDPWEVSYDQVYGAVEKHYPVVGRFLRLVSGTIGKIYLLAIGLCGVLANILASLIRRRRNIS